MSLFGRPAPAPRTQGSRETDRHRWPPPPTAREPQLGRDVPVQNGDLELRDRSTWGQRERQSLRAQREHLDTPRPPKACTASFHLSSPKTEMELRVVIDFWCLGSGYDCYKKPNGACSRTRTADNSPLASCFWSRIIKTLEVRSANSDPLILSLSVMAGRVPPPRPHTEAQPSHEDSSPGPGLCPYPSLGLL